MCKKETFYITTPIYYPSGNPHIGHCYTTVACDSIARYRRMQGYDVMFLTGTDEHGLKIEQKAAEKGVSPKEYVDEIAEIFKGLWRFMNISYDRYIRTTDDYHIESKTLYDKGYIYKGEYSGKYCTPCESFWTESQLVDGKCPECGREVTEAKEEAYFFKMSPFADRIEKLLTETDYLRPKTRATELVNNFIRPGLEDLCVSRTTFKWGIPVTFDDKHVQVRRLRQVLACRHSHGRKGHHALPRDHLACYADGSRASAAKAPRGSRMDHLQRSEDVQVSRQRR